MPNPSILALDVGDKRIGIAIASVAARLPRTLTTLEYTKDFWPALSSIIAQEAVERLVVGYPRGLSGQATTQTSSTETFLEKLKQHVSLPINLQDEALTSQKAETELRSRAKPYSRGDIDALAAVYILEDYLATLSA